MEVFPLYKSIGPAAANFFLEHITYQFSILTKLQATNEALLIGIPSRGNPTHPLQSHGSPMHYVKY